MESQIENVATYTEQQLELAASKDSVSRDFYGAALTAKRYARHDGFSPEPDEHGELNYTQEQGIKAACYGREDIAAVLIIQQSLLRRLETLYAIGSTCLLLLIYIAYRVS